MGNSSCNCVKQHNTEHNSELQNNYEKKESAVAHDSKIYRTGTSIRVIKSSQPFINGRVDTTNGAYAPSKELLYRFLF